MLTGKTKDKFESWYPDYIKGQREDYLKYPNSTVLKKFYREIESMQYGVYVDFFEKLGLFIQVKRMMSGRYMYTIIDDNRHSWQDVLETKPELIKSAIEKANKILNINLL